MADRRTQPLDPAAIRLHRTGQGTPLVMLHCLGMTHHLWDCLGMGLLVGACSGGTFPCHCEFPPAAGRPALDETAALSPSSWPAKHGPAKAGGRPSVS